jgi:hypothetical protein
MRQLLRPAGFPKTEILPVVRGNSPRIQFAKVDFPAPFGPKIPMNSPAWISAVMLERIRVPPKQTVTFTNERLFITYRYIPFGDNIPLRTPAPIVFYATIHV